MTPKAVLPLVAGLCLLSASALAADLRGTLPPAPLPPVDMPAFTWTGFYIGGHVGYGEMTDRGDIRNEVSNQSIRVNRRDDTIAGGGQIGYNLQIGNGPMVVGIEGDVTAGDFKAKGPETLTVSQTQIFAMNRDDVDLIATVKGRIGYAIDRTLLYATGGLAIRDGETTRTQYATSTFDVPFSSRPTYVDKVHDTPLGYAVGAGIQYAFADHWSVKAEYNYLQFDDVTATYPHGLAVVEDANSFQARRTNFSEQFHLAKVGVNYQF